MSSYSGNVMESRLNFLSCIENCSLSVDQVKQVLKEDKVQMDASFSVKSLNRAIMSGVEESACTILDHSCDCLDDSEPLIAAISSRDLLYEAAKKNMPVLVEKFIHIGFSILPVAQNHFRETVLHRDMTDKHIGVVVMDVLLSEPVLLAACKQSSKEAVLALLDELLASATNQGHEQMALLLLSRRRLIAQDSSFKNPIHELMSVAARKGLNCLLEKITDVTADTDFYKLSFKASLLLAVREGHSDAATVLLHAGCSGDWLGVFTYSYLSLLDSAFKKCSQDVICRILAEGEKRWGASCLLYPINRKPYVRDCAMGGKLSVLEKLIEMGADVNTVCSESYDDKTPLYHAVRGKNYDIVKALVSAGGGFKDCNVDTDTLSLLIIPTRLTPREQLDSSTLKLTGLLASLFEKANILTLTAFRMSLSKALFLQALEDAGIAFDFASPDSTVMSSVVESITDSGVTGTGGVLFYLEHGLPVNSPLCAEKNTAIHYCVTKVDLRRASGLDMALMLLKWGADPLTQNRDSHTALHLCLKDINKRKKILLRFFLQLGYRIPTSNVSVHGFSEFEDGVDDYTDLSEKYPSVVTLQSLSAIALRRQGRNAWKTIEALPKSLKKIIWPQCDEMASVLELNAPGNNASDDDWSLSQDESDAEHSFYGDDYENVWDFINDDSHDYEEEGDENYFLF